MKEILYSQKLDTKADQPPTKEEEPKDQSIAAEGSTLEVVDDNQLSQKRELAEESGVEDSLGCNQPLVKKVKLEQ